MQLEKNTLKISNTCLSINGRYTILANNQIQFELNSKKEKSCKEDSVIEQEYKILENLKKINSYTINYKLLELKFNSKTKLSFTNK